MKIGIIAEGPDDRDIIAQIVKKLKGIDISDMIPIMPRQLNDETDNLADNFSNWELVLNEASEHVLIDQFFDQWSDFDPVLVIHIDTAERGLENYNVTEPQRTANTDYKVYSEELRKQVRNKIESLLPPQYRNKVSYAIAIEETEAWLIPLFDNRKGDSASHADPKAFLERLISKDKKFKAYYNTSKKRLDAVKLGNLIVKKRALDVCRSHNRSLDLFCLEVEAMQ